MKTSTFAAVIVSLSLGGATTLAQSAPATTQKPATSPKPAPAAPTAQSAATPQEFVRTVSSGGAKEVELGKLAAGRAMSGDVKAFANRMVADHSKGNAELSALATKKSWAVKADPAAHKADIGRLNGLSGAAFDRAYIDMMVADHQKNVALFEQQAKSGSDPDLKAWAAKKLPTLQEHLKQARDTQAKLKS